MPGKSIYPSIPAPGNDMPSIRATLDAMRQSMSMITMNAQHPNPNFSPSAAAQVFVTRDELKASGVVGQQGPAGPRGAPGAGIAEAPNDTNTYGRHQLGWVPIGLSHGVRVSTTNNALNNAVANGAVLQFDTVGVDADGFAPVTTPFTTITVPPNLGGVYLITARSSGSGNQSTTLGMSVLINGALGFAETNQSISGPGSVNYILDNDAVQLVLLSAGDTIQLKNNSVSSGTNVFTSVSMALVRLGALP